MHTTLFLIYKTIIVHTAYLILHAIFLYKQYVQLFHTSFFIIIIIKYFLQHIPYLHQTGTSKVHPWNSLTQNSVRVLTWNISLCCPAFLCQESVKNNPTFLWKRITKWTFLGDFVKYSTGYCQAFTLNRHSPCYKLPMLWWPLMADYLTLSLSRKCHWVQPPLLPYSTRVVVELKVKMENRAYTLTDIY